MPRQFVVYRRTTDGKWVRTRSWPRKGNALSDIAAWARLRVEAIYIPVDAEKLPPVLVEVAA